MSDIDVRFLHFSDGSLDVINQHQQQHLSNLPQKDLKEEEIWFYWVEFVLSGMSFLKPDWALGTFFLGEKVIFDYESSCAMIIVSYCVITKI